MPGDQHRYNRPPVSRSGRINSLQQQQQAAYQQGLLDRQAEHAAGSGIRDNTSLPPNFNHPTRTPVNREPAKSSGHRRHASQPPRESGPTGATPFRRDSGDHRPEYIFVETVGSRPRSFSHGRTPTPRASHRSPPRQEAPRRSRQGRSSSAQPFDPTSYPARQYTQPPPPPPPPTSPPLSSRSRLRARFSHNRSRSSDRPNTRAQTGPAYTFQSHVYPEDRHVPSYDSRYTAEPEPYTESSATSRVARQESRSRTARPTRYSESTASSQTAYPESRGRRRNRSPSPPPEYSISEESGPSTTRSPSRPSSVRPPRPV